MELTRKQEEGLKIAIERYNKNEKYTVISGYAGTGKSTLVKFIIAALGVEPEEDVVYTSYTGKATQVLQSKGNKNVSTLHRLLFEHFPTPNGGFFRRPVEEIPYAVVVVDEVSMVPKDLIEQLFKYNVHVICLGDPFQLPPVDKNSDNGLLRHPHVFLDEIMRQAAESEIIRLSMMIRHGEDYTKEKWGKEVMLIPDGGLTTGMLTWADQILCGTNATRQGINNQMRDLLGRGESPENGDKVICVRNYWDYIDNNGDALVNGTIGFLQNPFNNFRQIPTWVDGKGQTINYTTAGIITETDSNFETLNMDKKMILTGQKCITDYKLCYKLGKLKKKLGDIVPLEFLYGYAITVHKSQGSQWPKGLIVEESFPFAKEDHARWLYTAVTRFEDKVVLKMNK